MWFKSVLMHQIYCGEYFGTILLSSGFVAKGVAQFAWEIQLAYFFLNLLGVDIIIVPFFNCIRL